MKQIKEELKVYKNLCKKGDEKYIKCQEDRLIETIKDVVNSKEGEYYEYHKTCEKLYKNIMTTKQEEHLQHIKDEFCKRMDKKYRIGQNEHGGDIWLKTGIIDMAIEEIDDLQVYLITLKDQIKDLELGSIKE